MSTVPQDSQGGSASPPPSYGDAADKNEPDPATQQAQPGPQPGQLPPRYAYQPQPVQQVQYMVPAPVFQQQQQQPVVKPDYPAPHDYLILSIVVLAVCSVLHITSLAFGIPALIFSILSYVAKSDNDYVNASRHSRRAVYLIIANIVYTLLWTLAIIALTIGLYCGLGEFCS